MRFRTKNPALEQDPAVVEWLENVSGFLPSDEDWAACHSDFAIFGEAMLRWKDGRLVRVPPAEWKDVKPSEARIIKPAEQTL